MEHPIGRLLYIGFFYYSYYQNDTYFGMEFCDDFGDSIGDIGGSYWTTLKPPHGAFLSVAFSWLVFTVHCITAIPRHTYLRSFFCKAHDEFCDGFGGVIRHLGRSFLLGQHGNEHGFCLMAFTPVGFLGLVFIHGALHYGDTPLYIESRSLFFFLHTRYGMDLHGSAGTLRIDFASAWHYL